MSDGSSHSGKVYEAKPDEATLYPIKAWHGPALNRNKTGTVFGGAGTNGVCTTPVANRLLGSNATYLLIFSLRQLGRYPSTLFRPGPISSAEIWVRELKRGASS